MISEEFPVILITEPLLIGWHLQMEPVRLQDGALLHSTLTAPLKEIRRLAVRDELTGKHLSERQSPSWVAAMGYFSLIEQLGNAYECSKGSKGGNNFKRSLKIFSGLNEKQVEVLWGLRCSLFHDFAIVRNEGKPKYIFNVGPRGTASSFIREAAQVWRGEIPEDGNLSSFVTTVDLWGIGDLFETAIFPKVKDLASSKELKIRKLSLVEFQLKYFWMIGSQK